MESRHETLLHYRPSRRWARTLVCVVFLVGLSGLMGLSGCSFIFDFTECEADQDCQSFDDPGAGEFFKCSAEDKCVLEPERQCRTDSHCDGSESCEQGVCAD